MWSFQVIEIGTGKLLNEFFSRNRAEVEDRYKEFKTSYPSESVIMGYDS